MLLKSAVVIALALCASANVQEGKPNQAPKGYKEYISPIVVPSPQASGSGDWASAIMKAKRLVHKMTLEELVNITSGTSTWTGRCAGWTGSVPRLGIKSLCFNDSPSGVANTDFVTSFPIAITLSSTWDRKLMRQRGIAMGKEFRGKGNHVMLGPTANMVRAPAGGRGFENWGGDPFISGIGMYESVRGIQSQGVIATAKHLVGNEQEHMRGGLGSIAASSNIDDRTMHEIYMWPFAEAVRAGTGAVMCSYNRLNQTHACENSKLINGLLKEELDFQGFVMSDWWATETGVSSVLAGLDSNMPGSTGPWIEYEGISPSKSNLTYFGTHLIEAVRNGTVPLSRVQDMVTRTLGAYFKMGQDEDYPEINMSTATQDDRDAAGNLVNEHVDVSADHYKLAREIAAAGTVLLKNTRGALPLNAHDRKKWAVFGSDAGPRPDGSNAAWTRAEANGTLPIGWGSATTLFSYLIDPYYAIRRELFDALPNAAIDAMLVDWNTQQASVLAKASDTCLVFVQANSGEGIATVDGNAGDRNNLTLWNNGEGLIKAVADNCADTIVVIHSVGAVDLEKFIDHKNVTAVVWANLPGQESGNAIVDILFNHVNPSGRLAYTLAKKRSDWPYDVLYTSNSTQPQITYDEKLLLDYRYFDSKKITPRYEFGHGLSYTTFKYSDLDIRLKWNKHTKKSVNLHNMSLYEDAVTVKFHVKNTGEWDGHEVSQLYLGFPKNAGEPPKVLRGFERTMIKKGKTAEVTIKLNKKALSIWDVVTQSWKVPSGEYKIYIGQSSRKIVLTGSMKI